jgi:Flp pilus assembly protein TadD
MDSTTGTDERTDDVAVMVARADALLAEGEAGEAVALLQRVTREHPDDAWLWHRLAAGLLALDGGPESDAVARDAAERAVTLDPGSAVGYRLLSEASLRLDDPESALNTMHAAVQAAPDSWVAHLDLAAALSDKPGGEREAWRAARRAAKLVPAGRPEPHVMLGDFALRDGDLNHAAAAYTDALEQDPDNGQAQAGLADVFERMGGAAAEQPGTAATGIPDATRTLGNFLAGLAVIGLLGMGMLLVLAPDRRTGWFTAIVLMAVGGLALVGAAVLGGARTLLERVSGRLGYLAGLGAAAAFGIITLATMVTGAFTGEGTGFLRAALCTTLAMYAVGHGVARFADRTARLAPPTAAHPGTTDHPTGDRATGAGQAVDDRPPEAVRSGAFISLAMGNLLHAAAYGLLILLAGTLMPGTTQLIAVLLVGVVIFLDGIQLSALYAGAQAHRRRFGWWPVTVLAALAATALISLFAAAVALTSLFTATPTVLLTVAVGTAVLAALVTALAAVNLRR